MTSPIESAKSGSFPLQSSTLPPARLWTGRILTALATLFLLVDAVGKIAMPPQVMNAFVRLGFPTRRSPDVALLLLVSTLLYAFPRTSVFGAVLLTGFLGGAVAVQLRAGSPTFETVFPVLFGVLVWAGIYLRECRLGQVFPLRRFRN